jgi:hypothetical protein
VSVSCGRADCGLGSDDRFCMTCGKAAGDVAATMAAPPESEASEGPSRPITAALSDFATGATEQNVVYLGNRLMYNHDAEEMDPVRNPRVLGQLLLQMFLFVAAPMFLTFGLGVLAAVLAVVNAVADNPLTSALGSLARIGAVLGLLATMACWVIGWFRTVPIRNAEWIMFLDDKGPAAPTVFAQVTGAFQRRATPADSVRVKRVPLPGGGHRDMLEVRYRVFIGYITAYAFGRDLHIGWVYYWNLSLWRHLMLGLGNVLNGLRGRQTEVHVLARYEPAKTMREALHAAAREGVDIAGAAAQAHDGLTMPANVPVDAMAAATPDGNGLFAS